jgi:hypothetical protein
VQSAGSDLLRNQSIHQALSAPWLDTAQPILGRDEPVTEPASGAVPAHVQDTIQAVARFHAAHEADASPLQRLIEKVTRRAGRPAFIALLTGLVGAWIALNLGLSALARTPFDEPRFFGCKVLSPSQRCT